MKTPLVGLLVASFLMPGVGGNEIPSDEAAEYRRLVPGDEKAHQVIAVLEKILIDDISFHDLSVFDALNYLNRKVVGEMGGGGINFVIRPGERRDAGREDEEGRIGITRMTMSFAHAVDEICVQAGMEWNIEFNEIGGAPILVLGTRNEGQHGGAPSP